MTCYSNSDQSDAITGRLRAAADRWCSLVGLSDEAAPERIRTDRIDILVDLGGHTRANRLPVFARKPTPLQFTYLGFPSSTGLAAVDRRVTDAVVDPVQADTRSAGADSGDTPAPASVCEAPLRLEGSAWCFAPLVDATPVAESPALRSGSVTFGCFASLKKIPPTTIALWSAVLAGLPASRLQLKSRAFREAEAVARFQALFAPHGVDASRLDLLPDDPSLERHLQSHADLDIVLDSFPFHGLTTSCQALWMGVPVVTLVGDRPASRMGASVLTSVGLPELIAASPAAFVDAATRLANDLPRLGALRRGLRARLQASPLMDGRRVPAAFEAACRTAWRGWCARP